MNQMICTQDNRLEVSFAYDYIIEKEEAKPSKDNYFGQHQEFLNHLGSTKKFGA